MSQANNASAVLIPAVEAALESIRPILLKDGGDIRLVEITGDLIAVVEFQGHCIGCPSSVITMKMGVERAILEQVPAIRGVREMERQRPAGTSGVYTPS
ncbi:MAG: NifU family protein [bacterium]